MADVTRKPWDGSASRFSDTAAYCCSCLIDDNPSGKDKVQSLCHLPVREPSGEINANAVHSAAAALAGGRGGVKTSPASKKKAAKALVRLYGTLNEPVPPSIKQMAQ